MIVDNDDYSTENNSQNDSNKEKNDSLHVNEPNVIITSAKFLPPNLTNPLLCLHHLLRLADMEVGRLDD